MKKILLILTLFGLLNCADSFDKPLENFESAVSTFDEAVDTYKSNVYFFEDKDGIYHVAYDPDYSTETNDSFLQIYASQLFTDTLTRYRQIEDKSNLYIKKFNNLYFLRLSDKDHQQTQKMQVLLQVKYPDMYLSRAVKKPEKIEVKKEKHTIVFVENKQAMIKTNTLQNLVFSLSQEEKIPTLKTQKIFRAGSLEKIDDLKSYRANFAIIRGDVLGMKNAGLYGFEPFTNYGLLCSTSEEMLYLVSKAEINSVYDLRKKSISVGNISDIAQVYLQEIIKDSGVMLDINFKSYSYKDSIKKLKDDEIDAFFLFAPRSEISNIANEGLYISSIPDDFAIKLNKKQGLNNVKYKINDRMILSYKVPNFVVAVVATLDANLSGKIQDVVTAFGCNQNAIIPDAFYGNVHPLLVNAIASIQAETNAASAAQKLLDIKNGAVTISFFKEEKSLNTNIYYYQITNVSAEDVNLTFENVKTDAFDDYAFKPRHVIKLELSKPIIDMKAHSQKLISFKYSNPFATRLQGMKIELNFQEMRLDGKHFSIALVVGDK